MQKPLATVIGGLLTAAALTLLVLPAFAVRAIRPRGEAQVIFDTRPFRPHYGFN